MEIILKTGNPPLKLLAKILGILNPSVSKHELGAGTRYKIQDNIENIQKNFHVITPDKTDVKSVITGNFEIRLID